MRLRAIAAAGATLREPLDTVKPRRTHGVRTWRNAPTSLSMSFPREREPRTSVGPVALGPRAYAATPIASDPWRRRGAKQYGCRNAVAASPRLCGRSFLANRRGRGFKRPQALDLTTRPIRPPAEHHRPRDRAPRPGGVGPTPKGRGRSLRVGPSRRATGRRAARERIESVRGPRARPSAA